MIINEEYIKNLDLDSIDLLYTNLSNQLVFAEKNLIFLKYFIETNKLNDIEKEKNEFNISIEEEIIKETKTNMECIENCLLKILKKGKK